jgi:hypothetical protein
VTCTIYVTTFYSVLSVVLIILGRIRQIKRTLPVKMLTQVLFLYVLYAFERIGSCCLGNKVVACCELAAIIATP